MRKGDLRAERKLHSTREKRRQGRKRRGVLHPAKASVGVDDLESYYASGGTENGILKGSFFSKGRFGRIWKRTCHPNRHGGGDLTHPLRKGWEPLTPLTKGRV